MSSAARPRQASMAAEPVSPDVATTIVARSPRRVQLVVEEAADELQGDVLEGERRARGTARRGRGRSSSGRTGQTSGWVNVE